VAVVKKVEWTVRVVSFEGTRDELPGVWIEQLRKMGYARAIGSFENPDRTVVEFYAPRGLNDYVWSRQNAERMCSFGLCAAPAPKWGSDEQPDMEAPFPGVVGLRKEGTDEGDPDARS
jgi:hypothetical protein